MPKRDRNTEPTHGGTTEEEIDLYILPAGPTVDTSVTCPECKGGPRRFTKTRDRTSNPRVHILHQWDCKRGKYLREKGIHPPITDREIIFPESFTFEEAS